ncbi:hypothetical protein PHLGIDRAFT_405997 [Phlebiopsis gigantea 11061_1 CR5-6]|uniref:Helicase C-terminal domain-containing protein n=1 Tax=Phlebiopsis gigantea (strain 11061_1 CR5-6) TaxID=745531 RepID=A0A0C3NRJ4_PHLG1|nr:hypothetical protein PHLGIDRAFT_405997 [Phlebiopsis gigantea 11061_1 CR5-6]
MAPYCSLQALQDADHAPNLSGPFALQHFLPAGTLHLTLQADTSSCYMHEWHHYCADGGIIGLVQLENEPIVRLLDFLILHHFVSVTCRIGLFAQRFMLVMRVYLIPHDLANVDGRLRRRDEVAICTPARKYLSTLLPRLSIKKAAWNGISGPGDGTPAESFMPNKTDNRTLAEIYNTLPSPRVQEDKSLHEHPIIRHVLTGGPIPGLQTILYKYQRNTVAAMIQRELSPGFMPDPVYVPIVGVNSVTFFLQPATMEILRDRPSQSQMPGGILCEELGTGKTVMTLALIMATMDQLSSPEESILDPPPVLTPLSFRYSSSPVHVAARKKIPQRYKKWPGAPSSRPRFLSLVEHALDVARLKPGPANVRKQKDVLKDRHLWTAYKRNTPFYHKFEDIPLEVNRPSRQARGGKGPKTMYLTAGTLVVVPPNLMNQWASEMNKHCDESLNRFIATDKELPPAELLALNDVVLMSHSRLSLEAARLDPKNASKLYSWRICSCDPSAKCSAHVPRCTCDPPSDVSPLLQIRWKRLVVDEGNNLSNANTGLFVFLKGLSVEAKWIVTGTPTTNLMGLQLGIGELQYPNEDEEAAHEEFTADLLPDHDISQSASRSTSVTPESVDYVLPPSVRIWTKEDRGDLNKLGTMLSSFLEVPQFAAGSKVFGNTVVTPLFDSAGPRPGSIQVLSQVMENMMLRHRIEDVEREIVLPTLTQETVLLDMDLYGVKTYNVLQALIAVNAITSEREGVDYFFHPDNVANLQRITENTLQAMSWHTLDGSTIRDTENALILSQDKLKNPVFVSNASKDDLQMLKDSVAALETALADPTWRALQKHPVIHPRVFNLPEVLYQAWSDFPADVGTLTDPFTPLPYVLLNAEHLAQLRTLAVTRPLCGMPTLVQVGELVREEERLRAAFNQRRKKMREQHKGDEPRIEATPEMRQRLLEVQESLTGLGVPKSARVLDEPLSSLLRNSPLAGVRWGNTPSAKVNYVLNEVQQHASTAKFLIFSKEPLTLAYVAEGLSLLNIKYTSTVYSSMRVLEQNVTTFESSDTLRVFLMELKYGARGLNIISASRVIFCEPVWQADVETQAIKRVHRIGQTRPVSVKTLAIRSTAEEFMLARCAALKRAPGGTGRQPGLVKDTTMRDFIANPKFLPPPAPPGSDDVVLDYALMPALPEDDGRITLSVRPSGDGGSSSVSVRISPKRPRAVSRERGSEADAAPSQSPVKKRNTGEGPRTQFA